MLNRNSENDTPPLDLKAYREKRSNKHHKMFFINVKKALKTIEEEQETVTAKPLDKPKKSWYCGLCK